MLPIPKGSGWLNLLRKKTLFSTAIVSKQALAMETNTKTTTTASPRHLSRTYSMIKAKNKEQMCLKPEMTFHIHKSNVLSYFQIFLSRTDDNTAIYIRIILQEPTWWSWCCTGLIVMMFLSDFIIEYCTFESKKKLKSYRIILKS